jgi:hypothetical protein
MSSEDLNRAIIHFDRKADRDLALAYAENPAHGIVESHDIGRTIELRYSSGKQIPFMFVIDRLDDRAICNSNHGRFASFGNVWRAPLRARTHETKRTALR